MPLFPAPADQPTHEAQRRRDAVSELIDIAMNVARALGAQTVHEADVAVAGDGRAPDTTAAFERAPRAVRRTVLLAERLDQTGHDMAARSPGLQRTAARKRVIRAVEDAIGRQAEDDGKAETLHREFQERLDAQELDEALADQDLPEIIADIMHDLGLGNLARRASRDAPHPAGRGRPVRLGRRAPRPPPCPPAAVSQQRRAPQPARRRPASRLDHRRLLDKLPSDVSQWTDAQLEAAMAKAEYEARRARGSG